MSLGTKTWAFRPPRAAYAPSALPALPAEGRHTSVAPSDFAIETARDRPRALKEPVGLPDSSLIERRGMPMAEPRRRAVRSGVKPFTEADPVVGVVDRQHVVVPPHRRLAQREVAGAHVLRRLVEVVAREQGAAALAEGVDLPGRVLALAARAFEVREGHARL